MLQDLKVNSVGSDQVVMTYNSVPLLHLGIFRNGPCYQGTILQRNSMVIFLNSFVNSMVKNLGATT